MQTTLINYFPEYTVGNGAALLQAGRLVAFPTETVYGLGADARNAAAVAQIYQVKGRPSDNPLIVHIAEEWQAEELAEVSPLARRLMTAFWPGPLTLVLPLRPGALPAVTTGGLNTVGCVCQPTRQLCNCCGKPLCRWPRPAPTSPAGPAPPRPSTCLRICRAKFR